MLSTNQNTSKIIFEHLVVSYEIYKLLPNSHLSFPISKRRVNSINKKLEYIVSNILHKGIKKDLLLVGLSIVNMLY